MNPPENIESLVLDDPEAFRLLMMTRLGEVKTNKRETAREIKVLGDNGLTALELLSTETSILLGRFSDNSNSRIDLTPYGAQELGVSRVHARIHMEGDIIYLTDLNSRNGTFVDEGRLEPNQPVAINSGAHVTLGHLHLRLVFKTPKRR